MNIRYKGHKIVMYDGIQDLPIGRFQQYSLFAMIDSGVGSDIQAFDKRINNVRRLMSNDIDSASLELTNLQQNLRFVISKTSPKLNSFVCLIKKIDGKEIGGSELSETEIKEAINTLDKTRIPVLRLFDFLGSFKKKVDIELEVFFTSIVNNAKTKELYIKLKEQTILTLQKIQGKEIGKRLEVVEKYFNQRLKPNQYGGKGGVELKAITDFETICVLLRQGGISQSPKSMTTLSFYQSLDVIKEQQKKK